MYFKCIPNVFDFFARIHNEWLPKTTGKKMGDESDASEGDAMQVDEDTEMPQMNATLLKALSAHQKRCDKIRSASKNTTPVKSKRREHPDDIDPESKEEEDARKKLRPMPRELWTVPQIGLGECEVSAKIKRVAGDHRTVFFRRRDLTSKTGDTRCVPDGPFNDHKCLTWWKNTRAQLEHAERFSVPVHDHLPLRPLSTDTHDLASTKDHCSAALFAFTQTHRPTHLDIPRTPQVQGFCLPQFHGDRKSRIVVDGGAAGGPAGVADCLLWKMSVCADTLTVDDEIMQVLTLLCRALRGGLEEVIPGVATNYTEPHVSNAVRGCRAMVGGRFMNEYSDIELARRGVTSMSDDIDHDLLVKIADYRCVQNDVKFESLHEGTNEDFIIPKHNAVNDEDVAGLPMPADAEAELVLAVGLFTVSLFSHLMPGMDSQGCKRVMRVDCVRIVAKMPGVDPLIMLSQASKMPELVRPLHNVVSHMNMVLRKATAVSSTNMFSTGGNFQIAKICTESHLVYAVYLFADSHRIFDISFGGLRINVSSDSEGVADRRCYGVYLATVERARCEHYKTVFLQVTQDLGKDTSRHSAKPLIDFGLNFYQGLHYRSMPAEHLYAQAAEYVASVQHGQAEESSKVEEWLESVLVSDDRKTAYVAVGGGVPWNCGLFVAYNPDAFLPYSKPGAYNQQARSNNRLGYDTTPQPAKCAPLVEIFFESKASVDGFACLWRPDNEIILDIDYMKDNVAKLSAVLTNFIEEVNEIASSSTISTLQGYNLREEAILLLYGAAGEYKLKRTLTNTMRSCELPDMASHLHSSVQQHISSALSHMATGELLQFAWAARSVLDLKKQSEENGAAWLDDTRSLKALVRSRLASTDCADLLCSETQTALFINLTHERMNLEVSFMNQSLKESINWGTIAQFCSVTAWGVTVQMTNCASTIQVIITLPNQDRRAVTVNKKESSVGADTLCDMIGQENNAYGRSLAMCLMCSKFYNSEASRDKTCKWVSPLAMATFQGSGMAVGADGLIKLADGKGLLEAGLIAFFTENRKLNQDNSASFLCNLENFYGDSGAGEGTQRVAWSSTSSMVGVSFVQFYPFPCGMVCGNVQETREPRSTVDGGRTRMLNASVLDGTTGTIFVDALVDASKNDAVVCTSMRNVNETQSDKTEMKKLTAEHAHDHMVFCLVAHLRRKAFPFLHRVMTLGVLRASYVHSVDMRSLGNTVRDLTDGVRRGYFKNENTMNRTWDGPFKVVSLNPSWVSYTLERCIRSSLARASKKTTKFSSKIQVSLYEAFEDSIITMLRVPISFTCVLNALHLWQFASILDASVMIISSFQLFTMGMKQNCPLHVLALAANGHELTGEQLARYDSFAAWLIEAVTSPDRRVSDGESADAQKEKEFEFRQWGTVEAGQARGLSMTRAAHVMDIEKKDLVQWHTWDQDGQRDLMRGKKAARVNNDRNVYTNYMQSAVQYVVRQCPEWMETKEQERNGHMPKKFAGKYDPMSMENSENIIATAFAGLQTEACDEERAIRRQREHDTESERRGRNSAQRMPLPAQAHEYSNTFWQAAHNGTRLPQVDRKSNDTSDLVHPAAWLSPLFYQDAIATAGTGSGPIKQFLTLCEMQSNCSRLDLLKKLLGPYLARHPIKRRFQTNKHWTMPILGKTAVPCFAWGALPFEENGSIEGVHVSLNIDIVWLLVSQGLFANEWQGGTNTERCAVVHLRNLASANLVLLSLMIHTCVEKAAIPSNSGLILLSHQHPNLALTAPAAIVYDERLHVDSYLQNDTLDVSCVLSYRMRTPMHLRLLILNSGEKCLYYRNIINAGEPGCVPKCIGDLFPLPPESVYHMQSHFTALQVAYKRLHSTEGYSRNELTLQAAFMLYGAGVEEFMVTHIPSSLTHCVVREQREIPCVTYRHGLLFTLVVIHNQVHIVPTVPTHAYNSDVLILQTSELPVIGDAPHSFGVERMAEFVSSGLQLCDTGDGRTMVAISKADDRLLHTTPGDTKSPALWLTENAMPFALFPVVHWKHAVHVYYTHEVVACNDPVPESFGTEQHLRVVQVDVWFDYHKANFMLSDESVQEWLTANPDMPTLLDDECELFISTRQFGESSATDDRQGPEGQTDGLAMRLVMFFVVKHNETLFFQNKAHLKSVLISTGGMPFSTKYTEDWVERDTLIAGRDLYDQNAEGDEMGACMLMHALRRGPDGLLLCVREYDDSKFDSAFSAVQTATARLSAATSAVRQTINGDAYYDSLILTRRQELAIKETDLSKCTVEMRELHVLHIGQTLKRSWQLGPSDYWDQHSRRPAIGVVVHHPGTQQYLLNGRYHVQSEHSFRGPTACAIDFMTLSRCFLREGQPVYLRLSPRMYKDLRAMHPRVQVPSASMHDGLVANEIDFVDLVVYYLLGSSSTKESAHACVKVCILVHSVNVADMRYYYNEDSKHKLIVTVELHSDDQQNLYTSIEQGDYEPVDNLNYVDAMQPVQPRNRAGGLGVSVMW